MVVHICSGWGARMPQQALRRLHVSLGMAKRCYRPANDLKDQVRQIQNVGQSLQYPLAEVRMTSSTLRSKSLF